MIYSQYCCYKVSPEFEIILKYRGNELCSAMCSKKKLCKFLQLLNIGRGKKKTEHKYWRVFGRFYFSLFVITTEGSLQWVTFIWLHHYMWHSPLIEQFWRILTKSIQLNRPCYTYKTLMVLSIHNLKVSAFAIDWNNVYSSLQWMLRK